MANVSVKLDNGTSYANNATVCTFYGSGHSPNFVRLGNNGTGSSSANYVVRIGFTTGDAGANRVVFNLSSGYYYPYNGNTNRKITWSNGKVYMSNSSGTKYDATDAFRYAITTSSTALKNTTFAGLSNATTRAGWLSGALVTDQVLTITNSSSYYNGRYPSGAGAALRGDCSVTLAPNTTYYIWLYGVFSASTYYRLFMLTGYNHPATVTVNVDEYPNSFNMDVNMCVDGSWHYGGDGVNKFNAIVGGTTVASNADDLNYPAPPGTSYTITPVPATGYRYIGTQGGSAISGTYPSNDFSVNLAFQTATNNLTINPNGGLYNNSFAPTISPPMYNTTHTIAAPIRPGYLFHGYDWDSEVGFSFVSPTIGFPIERELANGTQAYDCNENGSLYTWNVTGPSNSCWNSITIVKYPVNAGETVTVTGQIKVYTNSAGIACTFYHGAEYNDYHNAKFSCSTTNGQWVDFSFSRTFDSATTAWLQIYSSDLKGKSGTMQFQIRGIEINCSAHGIIPATLIMPDGFVTLIAHWSPKTYTYTLDAMGGAVSATSVPTSYSNGTYALPTPTKTGYKFKGWYADIGANGPIDLGLDYKFDGSGIAVQMEAYMNDWSTAESITLISCTNGGGWNLWFDSTGELISEIYDSSIGGYRVLRTGVYGNQLQPGWHRFKLVISNNATLGCSIMVDSSSCGGTVVLSGGLDYANAKAMTLWLGAESSHTTGNYDGLVFPGYIRHFSIENKYSGVTDLATNVFATPCQNVTLYADWEPCETAYVKVDNRWRKGTMTFKDNNAWMPPSNAANQPPNYVVHTPSGASYGFALNANGFYESTNNGVSNSASVAQVDFYTDGTKKMLVECINYAESNYDFGILSNIGTSLTLTSTEDTTNVKKSFKGSQSASIQTVDYGTVAAGNRSFYIKYRKDSSADHNNDSLQFRIVFYY